MRGPLAPEDPVLSSRSPRGVWLEDSGTGDAPPSCPLQQEHSDLAEGTSTESGVVLNLTDTPEIER